MNHELISGIVNSLPIEKMVAAPLVAAVKAQTEMSMSLAHFVQDVGIDKDGNMRMVTMKYSENVTDASGTTTAEDRYIQAPFLAMTGLPNLAVETADISFDLEVNTVEENKDKSDDHTEVSSQYKSLWSPVSAKFSGNVTHSSEQTRHTDTRAKYSFNVSARRQGTPEAFMRIIDAVTSAVTNPIIKEPNDSKNLIENTTTGGKDSETSSSTSSSTSADTAS